MSTSAKPRRGTIYDCQGRELAVSVNVGSIYGIPRQIRQGGNFIIQQLCKILHLNTRRLEKKLDPKQNFVWIKRKVDPDVANRLKRLQFEGVGFCEESKRYFPSAGLAAQLLGFAGMDNHGLEGTELFFDELLRVNDKEKKGADLAKFFSSEDFDQEFIPFAGPYDLQLTINKVIQYQTEKELADCCTTMEAKAGLAIVMEIQSGEILAMANWPTYNLNNFSQYPARFRRNRCITDTFEPGSIFKIFLAASALEEKVLGPSDIVHCGNGTFRIGGRIIHDTHKHGWLSVSNVIKESSNIGSAKIGLLLGEEKFHTSLKNFGFGSKTGIQLPGEARGNIKPVNRWTDLTTANISFGQGILVTPLQIINAVCCLANQGWWRKPRILKALRNEEGEILELPDSGPVRRVLSKATCESVTKMLEMVVQSGTGTSAYLPGYRVAGKTGTAQKIDPESKRYSSKLFYSSFVGYFPANTPQIAILVSIDEPRKEHLGALVAAPVFRKIAQSIIRYQNIAPVEKKRYLKNQRWRLASTAP